MAKKTIARKQSAERHTALVSPPKASSAKVPPGGSPAARSRSARGRKKPAPSLPASRPVESSKPARKVSRVAAARAFVKGLVERGEVAESGAPLAAGMTHEVVGQKSPGTPQVARRRFSLR